MNDVRGSGDASAYRRSANLNDGGYGGHYGGYRDDDHYRRDTSDAWKRIKDAVREAWASLTGEDGRGRRTYVGRGPKGYRRSDDRIREDICERLTSHPRVDASDVEIAVRNGEVTLSGTVDERSMKRIAEDLVDRVAGVTEVINQIRVTRIAGAPSNGVR